MPQKRARLVAARNSQDNACCRRAASRACAVRALRELIEEIRLAPANDRLEIELAGALAGVLALSRESKKPVTTERDGLQVTLVAGARNHRRFTISVSI